MKEGIVGQILPTSALQNVQVVWATGNRVTLTSEKKSII